MQRATKTDVEKLLRRLVNGGSIRRYLVDHRFVQRKEKGTNYRANQTMINAVIEPEARSVEPQLIYRAVQEERRQRKRAAGAV